jgi:hypothetical protein
MPPRPKSYLQRLAVAGVPTLRGALQASTSLKEESLAKCSMGQRRVFTTHITYGGSFILWIFEQYDRRLTRPYIYATWMGEPPWPPLQFINDGTEAAGSHTI